jgi:hypothetical protein
MIAPPQNMTIGGGQVRPPRQMTVPAHQAEEVGQGHMRRAADVQNRVSPISGVIRRKEGDG